MMGPLGNPLSSFLPLANSHTGTPQTCPPYEPEMGMWQIECLIWTVDELVGLAAR